MTLSNLQPPRDSMLFITLDSCRYDTFSEASAPQLKKIGPLYKAVAPSYFTFGSHAAMFVGFTPGVAGLQVPYANPKYAKIFKMRQGGSRGKSNPRFLLDGRNIVDGFKRAGYLAIGTGAVGWFDPASPTGEVLSGDFDQFMYAGPSNLEGQISWITEQLEVWSPAMPLFIFINIGETHVPYYFQGAAWDERNNPCIPFSSENDAAICRQRQRACLEYVDAKLAPLLAMFASANILVCGDHGDCWGEDGLWEHGIGHEKVFEVPLLFRINAVEKADHQISDTTA